MLSLDREGQFSAGSASLVVTMQEQRRRTGWALQWIAAAFALLFVLYSTFPPSVWLCEPISGIFIPFPTLNQKSLITAALAPTVVANGENLCALCAFRR